MYSQLVYYFESNKLFYDGQYGFRENYSTELATLHFSDFVIKEMDVGNIPCGIFLDLAKAFDTLDHNILFKKLTFYGLSNNAVKLIESYFCKRRQYVNYNGAVSDTVELTTGVPQGSVLGPLLFLIYVNDISISTDFFKMILFADDTTLMFSLKSNAAYCNNLINSELAKLATYFNCNRLSLNVSKSRFMMFHQPQKKNLPNFIFNINGAEILKTETFNFLGLTINSQIKWHDHISNIISKISRIAGVFNKLKYTLPSRVLLLLYNTLILPHLHYGIILWGHEHVKVSLVQKKVIRYVSNSHYLAHTEPLFKKFKALKVEDIFKTDVLKFYFKLCNNKLPPYISNAIISRPQIHYNTRAQKNLYKPQIRHEFAKRLISYTIPTIVNSMPPIVTQKVYTHSYHGFVYYVKQFFFTDYIFFCNGLNCYSCHRNNLG